MNKLGIQIEKVFMFFLVLLITFCGTVAVIRLLNETILSFSIEGIPNQFFGIVGMVIVFAFVVKTLIISKKMKTFFYLSLVVFSIYNYMTPEEYYKKYFNDYYSYLENENDSFKKSKIGLELRKAIDNKDYEKLNTIFGDYKLNRFNPYELVSGLTKSKLLDKEIIVKAIENKDISKMFKDLTSERYVTLKDYEEFKNKVVEYKNINANKLSEEQKLYIDKL